MPDEIKENERSRKRERSDSWPPPAMALRGRGRRVELEPEVVSLFVEVCERGVLDAELVVLASPTGAAHACFPADERARASELAALLARVLRANSGSAQAGLEQVIQVVDERIQVFLACHAVKGCWVVAVFGAKGTNLGLALSQVNRVNKAFASAREG